MGIYRRDRNGTGVFGRLFPMGSVDGHRGLGYPWMGIDDACYECVVDQRFRICKRIQSRLLFFFFSCYPTSSVNRMLIPPDHRKKATFSELLRAQFRPLRALDAVPQHPLVSGQTWHDRVKQPIDQWNHPDHHLWRQPTGLGHLPVHQHVPRCLVGATAVRGTAGAAVVSARLSGLHVAAECVERILVCSDDQDRQRPVREAQGKTEPGGGSQGEEKAMIYHCTRLFRSKKSC